MSTLEEQLMNIQSGVATQPVAVDASKPTVNPAHIDDIVSGRRRRIPLATPQRKLEVDPIAGYHLHWFLEENIPEAMAAGYEMVKDTETSVTRPSISESSEISGNEDLGSNVKRYAGKDQLNRPVYFYLMKLREEWFNEDRRAMERNNVEKLNAIFTKRNIVPGDETNTSDKSLRYVKEEMTSMDRKAQLRQPTNHHAPLFNQRAKKA